MLAPIDRFRPPARGWVRAIREALGMTGVQFAKRLHVTPQTAAALERSEINGTIQLKTLRRAAEALGCTVVYAIVPTSTLEDVATARARAVARRELDRVAHSMTLEDQQAHRDDVDAQIDAYARDVVRDRDLWRDP